MQTFIGLLNYTDQEMQKMNRMAENQDLVEDMIESEGGELHQIYYHLGPHDIIIVAEYPDARAAARTAFVHNQEMGGELEMVPAFASAEFDELVEELDETPA